MDKSIDEHDDVVIEVTDLMLPLSCPLPTEELWNKHPRVFFPIKDQGHAQCPYCGNKFVYKKHQE
jgi:uncharacterized Zn-finger protein